MNYTKALLLAAIATLATFAPANAMEKEQIVPQSTYNRNRRRVMDMDERAAGNFQQNTDFLGNVSNSSGLEDSLGLKKTNNQTIQDFQRLQQAQQKNQKTKKTKKK